MEPHKHLLGQRPDTEIAEQLGLSMWVVRGYRKRQGIPAYKGGRRRGKAKGSSPKRTRPATKKAVASKPRRKAKKQDRVAEHHDLVGAVPDHVVAEKAGVHPNTVRNYRQAHGIPAAPRSAWGSKATAPKPTMKRRPKQKRKRRQPSPAMRKVAEHHDLVGVLPDVEVAAKAGVHKNSVWNYRKQHDIASPPRRGGTKSPLDAVAAIAVNTRAPTPKPRAASETTWAWKVVFTDGATRMTIGDTIVDAADRVQAAGLGEVESIERFGIALRGTT